MRPATGVRVLESGLERRVVGRESRQRRKMTAEGASGEEDLSRVGAVLGAVSRSQTITFFTSISGSESARGAAVVRADEPSGRRDDGTDGASPHACCQPPGEVDGYRATRSVGAIAIEVEQVRPARRRSGCPDPLDAAASAETRASRMRAREGRRRSRAASPESTPSRQSAPSPSSGQARARDFSPGRRRRTTSADDARARPVPTQSPGESTPRWATPAASTRRGRGR